MRDPSHYQVSVVIPVFNGAAFLRNTLDSVLSQTNCDFEVIAVDDGSTDGSAQILADYARMDSRVSVISKSNSGISDSLNKGIERSRATFVARIDADDLMVPERLARQVAFLAANEDIGFCSSAVALIDSNGRRFGRSELPPATRTELQEMINRKVSISFTHPAVMFRRDAIGSIGGYDKAFEPVEDLELFSRLIVGGRIGLVIPEVLTLYRVHGNSISGSSIQKQIRKRNFVTFNFYRELAGLPRLTQDQYDSFNGLSSRVARLKRHARIKCDINKQMALYHRAEGKPVREFLRYAAASLWQPSSAARYAARVVRKATGTLLPKSRKTSEASNQGVTTRY